MRASGVLSLPRGLLAALAVALLLAGCGSAPKPARPAAARSWPADGDGPGANPPPDLAGLPDAEPRVEPVRPGGANKPYQALGREYVPITRDQPVSERGLASWYGRKFHGRRTASGETYDMYAMTAAHPTLPIPSYARIRNPANGREVIVRVNDRGPFHAGRIVDLSYAAALKLDLLRGVAPVELDRLTFDEIRAGNWKRRSADTRLAAAASRAKRTPAGEAASGTGPELIAVAAAPVEIAEAPPAPTAGPAPDVAAASLALPVAAAAGASLAPALAAAAPAATPAARGFWVQLGAFRESSGAESFQRRVGAEVEWLAPFLATIGDATLYRVQAGPYPNRDEALSAAARVRDAIGLVAVIVERH
ncbi:MAG: septal ring lytic transglycosylase RlpA family protein [Caldimonas sp.]